MAVLISIRPKWVKKIASGEKTVEVRKTRPKLKTPFKCYIYCTKDGKYFYHGGIGEKQCLFKNPRTGEIRFDYAFELACCEVGEYSEDNFLSGKIIGEFICDKIYKIKNLGSKFVLDGAAESETNKVARESGLFFDDMKEYAGDRKHIYGWHISNLTLYDYPKELSEFRTHCKNGNHPFCSICDYSVRRISKSNLNGNLLDSEIVGCYMGLKRPPQSWCYVEDNQ